MVGEKQPGDSAQIVEVIPDAERPGPAGDLAHAWLGEFSRELTWADLTKWLGDRSVQSIHVCGETEPDNAAAVESSIGQARGRLRATQAVGANKEDTPMLTKNFSVAVMAAALLLAAPAYAQTSPQKQQTQEGGLSVPPTSSNAGLKQQTQEGGLSVPAGPNNGLKQQTQEGGLSVPPTTR